MISNKMKMFMKLLCFSCMSMFISSNVSAMEQIDTPDAYGKLTWTCKCGTVYAYGESCTNSDCPTNQ